MAFYVMDSAVILNNFNFSFGKDVYFATNEILDEIIDLRSRQLVESGLKQGKIKVGEPKKDSVKLIRKAAEELNIPHKLSEADISILALAFDLKFPLLTDDYHVQKVCLMLDLKFDSVFRDKIEK